MEDNINLVTTWQTPFVCLIVYILVHFMRLLIERLLLPRFSLTGNVHVAWEQVFLPFLPVVVGASFVILAHKFPFPPQLSSTSAKVTYGIICGFFSSWGYQWIKGMLKSKWNISLPGSVPPAPPGVPAAVVEPPALDPVPVIEEDPK